MHQLIVVVDPVDVCPDTPFIDKPFAKWLQVHREPRFIVALRKYLGVEGKPVELYRGCLTNEQVRSFRYTHQYTWYLRATAA